MNRNVTIYYMQEQIDIIWNGHTMIIWNRNENKAWTSAVSNWNHTRNELDKYCLRKMKHDEDKPEIYWWLGRITTIYFFVFPIQVKESRWQCRLPGEVHQWLCWGGTVCSPDTDQNQHTGCCQRWCRTIQETTRSCYGKTSREDIVSVHISTPSFCHLILVIVYGILNYVCKEFSRSSNK